MGQHQNQTTMASSSPAFLNHKLAEMKQLAFFSYKDFQTSLQEINQLAAAIAPLSGKRLTFKVKKSTDATVFWKATVRIRCHKVHCESDSVESCRDLNLKQYLHIYNEMVRHSKITDLETVAQSITNSEVFTNLTTGLASQMSTDQEECCICMDRNAGIILACSHAYCEKCISEWHDSSKTCPICRAVIERKDDAWVLTDKPDTEEMVQETTDYLLSLTESSGQKQSNS